MIKHPIALEDIKNKLEARAYTSLKDVQHDFETCFRNAKRYNMKDSQIFKDAKFLHVCGLIVTLERIVCLDYSCSSWYSEIGH